MPRKSNLKCYFGCTVDGPLHKFPKWEYPHEERFKSWKAVLSLTTQGYNNEYIHNNIRLCYRHFEKYFQSPSHKLIRNAVPTLHLSATCQMTSDFENIKFSSFKWLNEPSQWSLANDVLEVTTDNKTDFWQGTWYNFRLNTGHVYGVELKEDFTMEMCIEADFTTLYDQAGLMIYVDEKHWLKTGIEYNDGQPMIGSVLTNEDSDWGIGVYPGNPKKYWLRLTKVGAVVCIKYSTDGVTWTLLRLSPFPVSEKYFVGPLCCSPQREGLTAKFSGLTLRQPDKDILHSN